MKIDSTQAYAELQRRVAAELEAERAAGVDPEVALASAERQVRAAAEHPTHGMNAGDVPPVLRVSLRTFLAAFDAQRARIAELEAERAATGVEWGIRWSDGTEAMEPSEAHARKFVNLQRGAVVVNRTAPGPWREAE